MWSSLAHYHRPATVSTALRLLARTAPRTAPLAGGTWLIAQQDPAVEAVVDLSALNLAYVDRRGRRLHLGAMTRLQSLITHPQAETVANGLLAEAVRRTALRAMRNVATIGGTLIVEQSTSELALALLVLEAQLVIRASARRSVSLPAFFANRSEHLPPASLLIEIVLAVSPANAGAALADVSRTPRDRPIVNAAALVSRIGDAFQSVRLALGGVAPDPLRLPAAEALPVGRTPDDGLLSQVADAVSAFVDPPPDTHASAEYRREMAGVVVVRALREAWARAGGAGRE